MSESAFNKTAQKLVEEHGGYIVKTIVNNKAGVADMLACINGRFCAMEGKLPYNKMSALQLAHHRKVIQAGGISACIKSLDDVLTVIKMAQDGELQTVDAIPVKSFEL